MAEKYASAGDVDKELEYSLKAGLGDENIQAVPKRGIMINFQTYNQRV